MFLPHKAQDYQGRGGRKGIRAGGLRGGCDMPWPLNSWLTASMVSHTGSSQQDQSTLYQAALIGLSMLPNTQKKKP